MSLGNLIFIVALLSCLDSSVYCFQNLTAEALISEACLQVENRESCLRNVEAEVELLMSPGSPISILSAALRATLNEARLAIDMITKFNTLSTSYREQIAIQDCKELLDFSVSELAWSLIEMKKIHHQGNVNAWLSAALSNQDTCIEGFEGTDKRVENFIKGSLGRVTQLISNVLNMYTRFHKLRFNPSQGSDFPKWMNEGDMELLKASHGSMPYNAVVAADGSGNYRTITDAINNAPSYSNRRYIIYVKKGVYEENIDMKKKKTNIMLAGDGIGATVVQGSRHFMQGWTTFRTATVAVSGKGFIAKDITFRNTAGPQNFQAVALRVDSDQSAFYRCSMEGYQDTLYAHSLRQFYRECDIYGTIDFIFGNGAAVLQRCRIFTRVPLPLQKVTITAQGRKSPNQSTGFSIEDSFVYATQPTYLGRPWKEYSRTVFMNTYFSGLVNPRGWLEWYGNFALDTLWYGEYRNYGPGASLSGRVKWPGYHIIRDANLARFFSVGRFIDGMSWLPATGVKFTVGLKS